MNPTYPRIFDPYRKQAMRAGRGARTYFGRDADAGPLSLLRWIHGATLDYAAFIAAIVVAVIVVLPAYGQQWHDPTICNVDGGVGNFIDIDGRACHILSCCHSQGDLNVGETVQGFNRHGQPLMNVRVVAVDPAADLAIFEFYGRSMRPARLATHEPVPGEQLTFTGFPGGQPLRTAPAIYRGGMEASGSPSIGDSGGPIRNARGELVGILSGAPGGPVMFAGLRSVHRLIAQVAGSPRRVGNECKSAYQPSCSVQQNPPTYQRLPEVPPITSTYPTTAPPWPTEAGALAGRVAALNAQIAALSTNAGCNCGPSIEQLRVELNALNVRVQQLATPNYDALADEVQKRLDPINIRVLDRRGAEYSTEYQPVRNGQYVTLPFGPAQ